MSIEPIQTSHALKEWEVAVSALEQGKTIMLLRKGGIHEQNGRFHVAHSQVLLFPTYEHQQPSMLKAEYADLVIPVISGWHPETIRIGSWAEITDVIPVGEESIVNALLPFHIWKQNMTRDRLKWKPRQPLYVLLLRTYRLPNIQYIDYFPEYKGCKSWIDLATDIPLSKTQPVISARAYSQLVEQIRTAIALKGAA